MYEKSSQGLVAGLGRSIQKTVPWRPLCQWASWLLETGFKASKWEEINWLPQVPVTLNTMKWFWLTCLQAALLLLNLTLKGEFDFLRIKPKVKKVVKKNQGHHHTYWPGNKQWDLGSTTFNTKMKISVELERKRGWITRLLNHTHSPFKIKAFCRKQSSNKKCNHEKRTH